MHDLTHIYTFMIIQEQIKVIENTVVSVSVKEWKMCSLASRSPSEKALFRMEN